MWQYLPIKQKEKYKRLITNFASLSEVFSQKSEDDTHKVAPIVNSKFQETVFQKAFNAVSEDIANTSYDASLQLENGNKYLVGIKAFGLNSGDQKIAQFKSASAQWTDKIQKIKYNSHNKSKEQADTINEPLYREIAVHIATLRNERIASSKAQIKGFLGTDNDVQAVYHVLMSSKKGHEPQIFVGETEYIPIDISNLKIEGSTTEKNPTNFKFSDNHHTYKYTSADSQLLMAFKNKDIVIDEWDIEYIKDPFYVFENLHELATIEKSKVDDNVVDSVSWMITDEKNELKESSGFNAFDGTTKIGKPDRQKRIDKIITNFANEVEPKKFQQIITYLDSILLGTWKGKKDIDERKNQRDKLMALIKQANHAELENEIIKLVFRSASEVYIPIPDSKNFHHNRPDFFGKGVGTFKAETGKTKDKLLKSKEDRTFKLEFLSSGNVIDAYINQDRGKAIQSIKNQDILGKWLLQGVFQLKERERLTPKRLNELNINGIRLTKFAEPKRGIGLEFIWIDADNPPDDAVGWIAKKNGLSTSIN